VFSHKQCDQIGRIFIQWGIVCFGQSLESYRSIPAPRTFGLLYFMDKFKHKFRQKMGWAIFWAIFFSQIHLVHPGHKRQSGFENLPTYAETG
jgi:hypothetical protein